VPKVTSRAAGASAWRGRVGRDHVRHEPCRRLRTFEIGGELPVHRLGFGAMRITGQGIWGPPADRDEAIRVVRRAYELGITLIDTADSYGPDVSEEIIAEALHPYPDDLVIATKGGLTRSGPGQWTPNGRPEHLRESCEGSLRKLRVDHIDLYQLHRIDPKVPVEESVGVLSELRSEGKIRFVGLSEVGVDELAHVRSLIEVATVQNRYNLGDRAAQEVLEACERDGLGFIPWYPLNAGELGRPGGPLDEAAARHDATPGSSRSPGCSPGRPSCSRSRARARSPTSRRTSGRPTSS
jgi:aryl-alcohol dehydrogenase-like predicted oxidoreductase